VSGVVLEGIGRQGIASVDPKTFAGNAGNPHLPGASLLQPVVGAFQQFSSGSDQQDDITLVIARCLT
jgi:hypothetical protein